MEQAGSRVPVSSPLFGVFAEVQPDFVPSYALDVHLFDNLPRDMFHLSGEKIHAIPIMHANGVANLRVAVQSDGHQGHHPWEHDLLGRPPAGHEYLILYVSL